MARKKLFDGDLLPNEDWGGPIIREGGEYYDAASGAAVQKFIKNTKVGYVARGQQKEEGNFYYLYGFKDKDDYEKWVLDPTSVIPIFRTSFPNADTYEVNLTTSSSTTKLVNLGEGVKVKIRYTTVSIPSGGLPVDTGDEGNLIIQRSYDGSEFITVGTKTIQPQSYGSTDEQEVDLTPYLLDGDNKIRLRVEDKVNGSVSNNITYESIVNTALVVENGFTEEEMSKPLTSPAFKYYIKGQIAKTLHIRIVPDEGQSEDFSFAIGEAIYTETPYSVSISRVYETGTLNVEVWLSVDGTTLESNHINNQFYYINGSSTESVIILNNTVSKVSNYVNTKFFDYTVYNFNSDVDITIKNGATTYLTYKHVNCPVNTKFDFYNTLEIESDVKTLYATVSVSTKDMTKTFDIVIDNSDNMSPTPGASFILNPRIRSNTESTPGTIINSATGSRVESTWSDSFNFFNDGWCDDNDGVKVLRIPAGREVQIDYDPLDSTNVGTTIELDYKVYNTFSDDDTVLTMNSFGSSASGEIIMYGFKMSTTEAYFFTSQQRNMRDQDVVFQDEERTHLAINIIPNLYGQRLNYVRIFINGIMNREFMYRDDDVFKSGPVKIILGGVENMKNCDLDIYSIRVYKKSLSASDVRQDYLSSIPTTEGKLLFKEANNILAADGTISFDKTSAKYNTLIWTGPHPEYYAKEKDNSAGTLTVNIIGDPNHSGTITNLRIKGQGSSSKGYWKWNHQYDMDKLKDPSDPEKTLPSIWTDGNGVEHEGYYLIDDSCPKIKKMVAKLNWASSQQSHKIGSTALYQDLWKSIIGGSGISRYSQEFEKTRVAVYEKPFLYFIKETEDSLPVFAGLMTFGSGKADKPTFGIDINKKEEGKKYIMIEGSDNGIPLPLRHVPWIAGDVTYNPDEEYYEYAGQGQFDFDAGKTKEVDDKEYPADGLIDPFINAINFTYLHSHRLKYYHDFDELDSNTDKTYQYWCAKEGDDQYKVKRYDWITQSWVDAGIEKHGTGSYSPLKINEQTGVDPSLYSSDDELNSAFIVKRKELFKNDISKHYNVNDVLFSMAFLKLIAASDNWCKNTYEYYDPIDKCIRMAQDDMDTILLTDNVGRKTKPYYVEEHDVNSENGTNYWNGSDNTFYCLMEQCFESELKGIMKLIFDNMSSTAYGGSAMNCLQKYYFYVQEYFPAVAYNETARLLYEEAAYHQNKPNPDYNNGTPAISQSLGDQLQAEKQWWKRRLPYMQSWSAADPFYVRSVGSLNFRSRTHRDPLDPDKQINPTYIFKLTPYQWLYPKVGIGQTVQSDNTRVPAGQPYNTIQISTDGNTDTFIFGSNYYTDFGEFAGQSLGETFNLNGNKLLKFSANKNNVPEGYCYFEPTDMTVNCASLKSLDLNGISKLEGILDLSNELKLETVKLTGTNIKSVILPQSYSLTDVYLPKEGLTSITLINCININQELLDVVNYKNVVSISTDNSWFFNRVFVDAQNKIEAAKLSGIDLDYSESETYSNYLYDILIKSGSTCTGHIKLNKVLTIEEKDTLIRKYSSIDDPNGALYIEYIIEHGEEGKLIGDSTISIGKSSTITFDYNGNDVLRYEWVVDGPASYTVGNRSVNIIANNDQSIIGQSITVSCTPIFVQAESYTKTITIQIIDAIYVDHIEIDDMYIHEGSLNMNIRYIPQNYTIKGKDIKATLSENISVYAGIKSYNYNNIEFDIDGREQVTDTIKYGTVDVVFTDVEDNIKTAQASIYVDNPITEWYINNIKVTE